MVDRPRTLSRAMFVIRASPTLF